VLHASSERDFDSVFAGLRQKPTEALVIGPDILFLVHSEQLGALALTRYPQSPYTAHSWRLGAW